MTSYLIGIVIFLVISGIISGFSGAGYRRRRNASRDADDRGRAVNSAAEKRIRENYRKYVGTFLAQPDKDVPVPSTNERIQITKGPFVSDFATLEKTVGTDRIALIKHECQKYNDLYLDYVDAILSNALTGQFGFTESDVNEILEEYLDQVYVYFLNYFVGDALPLLIKSGSAASNEKLVSYLKKFNDDAANLYRSYFQTQRQAGMGGFFDGFFGGNGTYGQQSQYQQSEFEMNADHELHDAYRTLGVSETDTDDKIKKAYRALAKKYHPDRNDTKEAKEKMTEINSAYTVIKKKRNF